MKTLRVAPIAIALMTCQGAAADDVSYRYEGDLSPLDAGWIGRYCDSACSVGTEDGHWVIRWSEPGTYVSYLHYIATLDDPAPPLPAWIEWSFRSDVLKPPNLYTCDASFSVLYHEVHDLTFLFADAVVSFDGGSGVLGLDPKVFHTYRFETPDGTKYRFSVDGRVFVDRIDDEWTGAHYVAIVSEGSCLYENLPSADEWDFVRYGTISYGERIVAAEPPGGFLDAADHADLDRFTVTFDSPNYVYIDEIAVETFQYPDGEAAGLDPPVAIATRRLDNGPPDAVQIVLDKAIPLDARTVLTFDDGAVRQSVSYTYTKGDANADGRFDLRDYAELANCFLDRLESRSHMEGCRCQAFDFDGDSQVSPADFAALESLFSGP